ncbi:hypothetical protein [Paenibacillus tianjinensis]|uniref:hypothetical protein n=1 Tax=Paenibacillus tianjinensis TaxID=2810347 RepID=UPI001E548240|nr:hypothetical protein [Paenibacillus tianjinensis]
MVTTYDTVKSPSTGCSVPMGLYGYFLTVMIILAILVSPVEHGKIYYFMLERGLYPSYDLPKLLSDDVANANKALSL